MFTFICIHICIRNYISIRIRIGIRICVRIRVCIRIRRRLEYDKVAAQSNRTRKIGRCANAGTQPRRGGSLVGSAEFVGTQITAIARRRAGGVGRRCCGFLGGHAGIYQETRAVQVCQRPARLQSGNGLVTAQQGFVPNDLAQATRHDGVHPLHCCPGIGGRLWRKAGNRGQLDPAHGRYCCG